MKGFLEIATNIMVYHKIFNEERRSISMKLKKSMVTILGVLLLSFSIVGAAGAEPYHECNSCGGGKGGGGGGGGTLPVNERF